MKQQTALIGFHDSDYVEFYRSALRRRGYSSDCVSTVNGLMDFARKKQYDVYLMDINLEHSGSHLIEPAINLYVLVRERVDRGDAIFSALSASREVVLLARKAGIPARSKQEFKIDNFIPKQA